MPKKNTSKPRRPQGYPKLVTVQRGAAIIAQMIPDEVYLNVEAKLHNLGQRKTAALRQVFKIATLAAQWMMRDINEHKPITLFASCRKRNSTKYFSKGIRDKIQVAYRTKIRGKYTLNASVFDGLCTSLAAIYASTLQKITEAEKKGWLRRYDECAAFIVEYGKHQGKTLGSLTRDSIFGYAYKQPKREQYERALGYLNVLLQEYPEERALYKEAIAYKMEFRPRQGDTLGNMRPETLHRIQALIQRDLARIEQTDRLRKVAQDFLKCTPPSLPSIRSGIVSQQRRSKLDERYREALSAFAALPEDDAVLTEDEQALFRELQRRAYAATNEPRYVPLRWNRADGAFNYRDITVLYEPERQRYLFLAHILDAESHFRSPLEVRGDLIDINDPMIKLTGRERPSIAMLYELEYSQHQRDLLDLARSQAELWKDKGKHSGAVRAATLHAHHNDEEDRWWFEAHIAIALKPSHYREPQRVVGVHIDPLKGMFVCIVNLDGSVYDQFHLDELRIAHLLDNCHPKQQSQIPAQQRTAQERNHRLADALVAICTEHTALLGFENIVYRSATPSPRKRKQPQISSRTIFGFLEYKLPLANVPPPIDVKGVAPRRDCGRCGTRHDISPVVEDIFRCSKCDYCIAMHSNVAQEVARRTMWIMAAKKPPQPKTAKDEARVKLSNDISQAA